MRILLTGGSGDLGHRLAKSLAERGDVPVCLDIRPPRHTHGEFIAGSILDRDLLAQSLAGVDGVVHIAAWHGIHEFRQEKDVYDFWDLNVTGTFYVFEAAAQAGVQKVVYLSSTSVDEWPGVYGHTKILAEEIARTYAERHGLHVISLRPRAFIPYWNRTVYTSFVEWAKWFWAGAVHIDDVNQATLQAIDLLAQSPPPHPLVLPVDGAYDYSPADLAQWDAAGPGSTFKKYYAPYYDLALSHGLDPAQPPTILDLSETRRWLGYAPRYSLKNLLQELEAFGADGPPPPNL